MPYRHGRHSIRAIEAANRRRATLSERRRQWCVAGHFGRGHWVRDKVEGRCPVGHSVPQCPVCKVLKPGPCPGCEIPRRAAGGSA